MEKSSKSGSRLDRLAAYAGPYRWLTYAALVMSAVSAALSVVPYYYIWRILDEVLAVYPDLESASGIVHNGWMALAFTVLSIAFYIAALMCSHKAAFRISKNIKNGARVHGAVHRVLHRRPHVLAQGGVPHFQEHQEEGPRPCPGPSPRSLRHDRQRQGAQDHRRQRRGHAHLCGTPAPGPRRFRGAAHRHHRDAVLLRLEAGDPAPWCCPSPSS